LFKFFENKNIDFIISGLGNPGLKYKNTRHNVGFMFLDFLAKKLCIELNSSKFNSNYCKTKVEQKEVILLKPQTFMNLSGTAIVKAMNFYKITPEKLIVLLDDINFNVGKIRIRTKGTHGGHNGTKNIIEEIKNKNFLRIKIGIGQKPKRNFDLASWVLSKFTTEENEILSDVFEKCYEAIQLIIRNKLELALSKYN
jgi:PTH1 family peptidyl-tRNA hydrolase